MISQWKPRKQTVEMGKAEVRPSRIRRDPVRVTESPDPEEVAWWRSDEWELKLAIIGIVAFALAINIITYGISEITK